MLLSFDMLKIRCILMYLTEKNARKFLAIPMVEKTSFDDLISAFRYIRVGFQTSL